MNGLHDQSGLRSFQDGFAARIRNPQGEPLPHGVPERRMRVYEELLFNNLEGFLLTCYPITRQLLDDDEWHRVVRRFFIEHRCESPLFREIPREFLDWMEAKAEALFPEMPFLHEFMHYEWLELVISITQVEVDPTVIDSQGDLLLEQPLLNPAAELACYHYPVHQIGPDFQPRQTDGQLYCYLLYRDQQDQVQFILLNPVSARLLEMLQRQESTGREALLLIAREINHNDPEALVEAGRSQLEELCRVGVLLGTMRKS